ncbi:unnamed protein product [Microthlaspi erraticum]|uniref:FBD domain-containing protein n=1 Tax=Microthlaspi erraticum TaxID=1685480 RepID=A0A6D2I2V2_9BRAS|nr:unnamed protein product [Microthlaspi erraticum]
MVLSKRWRFLWTMLPKLYFEYGLEHGSEMKPSEYEKFAKYVDRSMVLNRAPVLEVLKFGVGACCSSEDLVTWIRIGMARHVRELEISDWTYDRDDSLCKIVLPKALYTYEKLEVLKLTYVTVIDVPTHVFLPSLKTLHLVHVTYGTETEVDESYHRLLSGCPVLEELVLDSSDNRQYCLPSLSVEMSALQRLSIVQRYHQGPAEEVYSTFVFNAPSLKYLSFVDLLGDLCLSGNMPELVEANVCVFYDNNPEKLLESLTSVKRLCLCLSVSTLQRHIGFYHLLDLELCGVSERWGDLLTLMLERSPKLQVLKIWCKEHYSAERIEGEEKKIVAYILKNAPQLKTAVISRWRYGTEEERSQTLSELVSLPRASSSCQLMFQ